MMSLPYEKASTGKNAVTEIQKILQNFGATSFGIMEDYEHGEIIAQFKYRTHPVTVKASAKGYAARWLRDNPHTHRHKSSKIEHERKAISIGNTAVYSILRDWIKGQITAIECGMLSFEGAFLGQIMLPTGQTVLEKITESKLIAIEHN